MKLLPFILLFVTSFACADIVTLNDGTRLEGTVQKTDGGWTITDASGKQTTVTLDQVQSIEASGAPANSASAAGDELASLRHSADNMSDLQQIIDRYQHFIDAHAGQPVADDAQADLAIWKQRQAEGQIKVGDAWMSQEDRQKMLSQITAAASDIRDLLEQGRGQQADLAINQAMALDPNNPSILYLQGYELANDQKNVPARADFDKVNAQVPNHAPTLNNLAIVLFRQKLAPAAMNDYVQAMLAEPDNKLLLANVAEALNALSAKDSKSPPALRAAAIFQRQNAELAKTMAAQGLFPWGATWITQQLLDQCNAVDQQNKQQLAQLQDDFDQTNKKIQVDQANIQTDQQQQALYEPQGYYNGSYNRAYARAGIAINNTVQFNELQNNITELQADVAANQTHLTELRAQASQLQNNYPVPKYTGTQQLIGPEGTPLLDPEATTQPAQ
jgi:hypothetical protein